MYMTENSNSKHSDNKVWVKLSIFDTVLLRIADYVMSRIQTKYDRNHKYNYMGYDPDDLKKTKRLAVYYTNIQKP